MTEYSYPILFGVIAGTIMRLVMLRTDYRQYPTYLHGKIIHIGMGFIAAGLGTIVLPSILEKDYTAVTFLALAASQFRDVRNMERNTLAELDEVELVKRGKTYIEGIAIAFEGRNYLVILTAFLVTTGYILANKWIAVLVFVGAFFLCRWLMAGSRLKDIVDIEYVEPRFDGPGLYVGNIYIMNIGHPERRKEVLKYGMGFILLPKNENARVTISNLGQRQAILHDVTVAMGVVRDSGTPSLVPLAKLDLDDGKAGIFVLPLDRNINRVIDVIGNVPALENAIRMPGEAKKKGKF
ncbi:YIEGIA family protein [Peribacillus sp. SCS-155]|uniref:YIEGIA family protein n=1 Tax=Peribacillus sedimenti TaxID=3115297 RepID=UPI003905FDB7